LESTISNTILPIKKKNPVGNTGLALL